MTLSFDAWKEGQVIPATMEIPVVAGRERLKAEAASKRLTRELVHTNPDAMMLFGIRFSPDGKRLVAGDYSGGVVVVWDVASGKPLTTIETGRGDRGSLEYFTVTPDWKSVFASVEGPRDYEQFERNGKKMYRWTFGGEVRSWNLETGQLQRTYRHDPPRWIRTMEMSPDGSRFITFEDLPGESESRSKQAISIWNVATGEFQPLPAGDLNHGKFVEGGKSIALVFATERGRIRNLKVFDAASLTEKRSIQINKPNVILSVVGSSAAHPLFVADCRTFESDTKFDSYQSTMKWWDAETGAEAASFDGVANGTFYNSHFSPDGRRLAVANLGGDEIGISWYDVASRKLEKSLVLGRRDKGMRLVGSTPIFSADGHWLALATQQFPQLSGGDEIDYRDVPQPRIHLIDVAAGELRETLIAPQGFTRSLAMSPDGRWLATGGHGIVHLWDLSGLTPSKPHAK